MDKKISIPVTKEIWDSCLLRANDILIQFAKERITPGEGALTAAFIMSTSILNCDYDRSEMMHIKDLIFSVTSMILDAGTDDSKHIKIKI